MGNRDRISREADTLYLCKPQPWSLWPFSPLTNYDDDMRDYDRRQL